MEEKDREVRIGGSKIYFSSDNILYVTVVGDMDDKIALAMKEATEKFKNMGEGKIGSLVDISKIGKNTPRITPICHIWLLFKSLDRNIFVS